MAYAICCGLSYRTWAQTNTVSVRDFQADAEFGPVIQNSPVLLRDGGPKMVRLDSNRFAVVSAAGCPLSGRDDAARARISSQCRIRAEAELVKFIHGTELSVTESVHSIAVSVFTNAQEVAYAEDRVSNDIMESGKGSLRALPVVASWYASDGTTFFLAIGKIVTIDPIEDRYLRLKTLTNRVDGTSVALVVLDDAAAPSEEFMANLASVHCRSGCEVYANPFTSAFLRDGVFEAFFRGRGGDYASELHLERRFDSLWFGEMHKTTRVQADRHGLTTITGFIRLCELSPATGKVIHEATVKSDATAMSEATAGEKFNLRIMAELEKQMAGWVGAKEKARE